MPPAQPSPLDPKEILTSRRIGAAITALADPNPSTTDPVFRLDESERDSIRRAVGRSTHPLVGFAHSVLDQWEDLEADDRVAGLLLFAEIVKAQGRERRLNTGRGIGRGVER
jgi:hypothetical protein